MLEAALVTPTRTGIPLDAPLTSDVWEGRADGAEGAAPFSDGIVVGIDLGTSNSCIALWHLDKSRVKVLKNRDRAGRTTPSAVRWDPGADPSGPPSAVGASASPPPSISSSSGSSSAGSDPWDRGCTVRCVKRIIGKRFDSASVQQVRESLPFELASGGSDGSDAGVSVVVAAPKVDKEEKDQSGALNGADAVRTVGAWVSPVDISAAVIADLKECAEAYLRKSRRFESMRGVPKVITKAVLGVPVYFTEAQRIATREAARRAGFTEVAIMAESTAAAVAYGLFVAGTKKVLVFDAGGGTTDVSLMQIVEGSFNTLATAGDNQLGGEDMDTAMVDLVLRKIAGSTPSSGGDAAAAEESDRLRSSVVLREACTDGRVRLSSEDEVAIQCVMEGDGSSPFLVQTSITRQEYDNAIAPLVSRARELVLSVLGRDASAESASQHSVDEVVLVGGASRTPALRQMLRACFPDLPDLCTSVDAHTSVAEGLAIRGAIASQVPPDVLRHCLMTDLLPLDIGVEAFYENGEEVADSGADDREVETRQESGSEHGGLLDVVLPKHTKLPATQLRAFQCERPDQPGVSIDLFEGDRRWARDNDFVGRFTFMITRRGPQKNTKKKDMTRPISSARKQPPASSTPGKEAATLTADSDRSTAATGRDSDIDSDVHADSGEEPRQVLLRFTMTEASYLTVEMVDDDFKSEAHQNVNPANLDEKALELLLAVMIAVLAALYLGLRMTVRTELDATIAAKHESQPPPL